MISEEARMASTEHMKSMEQWRYGEPIANWYDDNGTLCIRYASGKWWHYKYNNGWEWW